MTNTEFNFIQKEKSDKLEIKDLITLGLYSVLLILLTGVSVPICMGVGTVLFGGKIYAIVFISVVAALLCAPVYSLIFNKINKKWAIFITTNIFGLFMLVSGHAVVSVVMYFLMSILSEIFYRLKNEYLSYLFFALGSLGPIIPMYLMKDNYVKHLHGRNFSQDKIDFILNSASMNIFIVVVILTILFSFVGIYFGRKIYFKNFHKAGL